MQKYVYADSLTPVSADGFKFTANRDYPGAVSDFESTFAFLEATRCDILVTTHPDASSLWDRIAARAASLTPDPVVDSAGCRGLAELGREQLRKRIAVESNP